MKGFLASFGRYVITGIAVLAAIAVGYRLWVFTGDKDAKDEAAIAATQL